MNLSLKILLSLVGAFTGFQSGRFLMIQAAVPWQESLQFILCCFLGVLFAVIFFLSAGYIIASLDALYDKAERAVRSLSIIELGIAFAGLVAGLAASFFITLPLAKLNWIGVSITICVNFLFGYLGLYVALRKRQDITGSFVRQGGGAERLGAGRAEAGMALLGTAGRPAEKGHADGAADGGSGGGMDGEAGRAGVFVGGKLLDTSVIIDGRITDIVKTGFLEGELVIPEFVLAELRHIADSADALKRAKGRRGLDVLKAIQAELGQRLKIEKRALPEGAEVDAELVRFAQQTGYGILTTDYNLNKVASVQGVRVLNINELNNAIRPIAMPGEDLTVQIVKDGKEAGQGVAYLPDGTMIVVEGGKAYLGTSVVVTLTSVLQTAAGRMIFAKPR
ncbi:MAG: hypothetical protein LBU58_01225 [Clostridiales bacterium]|nr:hypothetical protein [Clostridiales bacterium]